MMKTKMFGIRDKVTKNPLIVVTCALSLDGGDCKVRYRFKLPKGTPYMDRIWLTPMKGFADLVLAPEGTEYNCYEFPENPYPLEDLEVFEADIVFKDDDD